MKLTDPLIELIHFLRWLVGAEHLGPERHAPRLY